MSLQFSTRDSIQDICLVFSDGVFPVGKGAMVHRLYPRKVTFHVGLQLSTQN